MPHSQLALDIGLQPETGFTQFDASTNAHVLAHLKGMIEALPMAETLGHAAVFASAPHPCYLWGDTGTGKTHLLQATALALRQKGYAVGVLNAAMPVQDPQDAQWAFSADWAAIILDDADRFNPAQQELAFNWFINASHPDDGLPRWVLAAGAQPAADLAIREDLRTRLGSGLTWQLQPLPDAARAAILQKQAQARGVALGDDVAQYILTHFSRDLNSLAALLGQLDLYGLQTRRAITIPMLKAMLREQGTGEE